MKLLLTEIRTGLLMLVTLALLIAAVLYVAAPGAFHPQHHFHVYLENAAGIRPGADVMLAGRRIGQVGTIASPVPENERPEHRYEALLEVVVDASARIYRNSKAQLVQTSLLGDPVVDFNGGREQAGLAESGTRFRGERVPGLNDAMPQVLQKLDPVLKELTNTLRTIQDTSAQLAQMAGKDGDLQSSFRDFHHFSTRLCELTGEDSALLQFLENLQDITGKDAPLDQSLRQLRGLSAQDGSLQKTFTNTEAFTAKLAQNPDLTPTLRSLRRTSETLDRSVQKLSPQIRRIGSNLEQATDTVKRQPWRLVWPGTKKYSDEDPSRSPAPTPGPDIVWRLPWEPRNTARAEPTALPNPSAGRR